MKGKSFVTAINCMDGRVQLPVINWLKREYKVDYVDMITEPGPNRILAENKDQNAIESIKNRVKISVEEHGSRLIAVAGHFACAGNPVEKETQLLQLAEAMKTISTWGFGVEVITLWVDKNWEVQQSS